MAGALTKLVHRSQQQITILHHVISTQRFGVSVAGIAAAAAVPNVRCALRLVPCGRSVRPFVFCRPVSCGRRGGLGAASASAVAAVGCGSGGGAAAAADNAASWSRRRMARLSQRTTPVHSISAASVCTSSAVVSACVSSRRTSRRGVGTTNVCEQYARLTPQDVSSTLRENEYTSGELPDFGPVKSFDMNTLKSNTPIEDAHAEAVVKAGDRDMLLFGIFDGHGGAACGQVVAQRLLHYIVGGYLSIIELKQHLANLEEKRVDSDMFTLIHTFNDHYELVADLAEIYHLSYVEYIRSTLANRIQRAEYDEAPAVENILSEAFVALDTDMSREAIPPNVESVDYVTEDVANMKTLTVALSGAVAVVALVDGPHLHVANAGDCVAVLGSLSENDTWVATKLTTEHNSDNQDEVNRILSEHPSSESRDIIRGDRLLGMLAPLRALGDFKFKWDGELIEKMFAKLIPREMKLCPPNYKTPPYLTGRPEVTSHRLTARDKFLVIGSDGLWDLMTPMQVIRLVGEHMSGKITLSPLQLSDQRPLNLEEINQILRHRQDAMKLKPADSNAATHLIRSALGGSVYGFDHAKLSQMLSLPQDMVRMFRDDITITVVFFDSEYIRHC